MRSPLRPRPAFASPTLLLLTIAGVLLYPHVAHADLGDRLGAALAAGSGVAFLLAFVGGVLTSLTPCVYPLIPITLSIFGAGQGVSRRRALSLAAMYVGGIALTYTTLGVTFALAGRAFGTFMANPFVMVPIALVFAVMAASMFGAFEINLPPALHERLNRVGGTGFAGAFGMGLVSGIIAAPCTGPVLASILTYVATKRSVFFGGSVLFTYAVGMGQLFFVLAGTGASLPRSGAWMDSVKSVFGVVMIVAALYFLRNVVTPLHHYGDYRPGFAGLHGVFLVAGVVIGGIHLSWYGTLLSRLRKASGIGLVTFGCFGLVAWVLTPKPLEWVKGEQAALARARGEHKPLLLDFGADWCIPCREMETVFGKDDVQSEMQRFVAGRVDFTDDSDENAALKAKYGATTLPTVVLLDSDGNPARKWNKVVEPQELVDELKKVK